MDYAVELGLLDTNPIRALKWTAPKVSSQVDRRSVVNPRQARALLEAVRAQQPSGPHLVAFFAVMYYAGLRPEEAVNLAADNVTLPELVWDDESKQWQERTERRAIRGEPTARPNFDAYLPQRTAQERLGPHEAAQATTPEAA